MRVKKTLTALTALAISLSMLSGCVNKQETEKDSLISTEAVSEKDTMNNSIENADNWESEEIVELAEPLNDNYVKWVIPNSISVTTQTQNKINEILDERYDIGVTFVPIDDLSDDTVYHEGLKSVDADIAFIGFDTEDEKTCEQLVAEGLFEPLDGMLEGSDLESSMPSQLWKSTEYNGNIYTVPNDAMQNIGVTIIFDLDKIPTEKARSFNGDISTLGDMLGDDDKLWYCLSDFDFSSYYGCYYSNGIIVTPDGVAESILDNADCMAWLREMNSLYLSGKATDLECDWSILITKDTVSVKKENVYTYKTKDIIGPRFSTSTGILKTSERKDIAFRLLEIVHTDPEIANLLVYGDGYNEKNGYVYDADGEIMYGYLNKLTFGVDSNVLHGADMLMQFDSAEDKKAYYDENVTVSPLAGMDISAECSEINKIMNNNRTIWKSSDLEKDIADLDKELNAANIKQITQDITEKLK